MIWSCDTGQWLSCFDSCQLTKLWMSDVKDVNLPRHAWDTPPFLLIVSPTLPVQSVDEYVRTYVRSVSHVTTKRKDVDHILSVWGSLPRALCARGSPTIRSCNLQKNVLFYCQTCQLSRFCLDTHDFFTFLTAFLENIFLKWNVTLLNKKRYSVGNSSACFNLDQEQQNFITFCRICNFFSTSLQILLYQGLAGLYCCFLHI